jgi:hypothetical protein
LLGLPNEFGELIQFDPKVYVVTSREGKHREFKQAFVENDFADYTKTLAAFGNAAGGCIVFGISDKPRKIVGIGNITDEAQWADRLKDEFDPEIVIASRVYVVDEMRILVIGVDKAEHRPIICKKNRTKRVPDRNGVQKDVEVLREGSIYYRYAAQTRTIRYPELIAILDERERRRIKAFTDTLNVVNKIGVENTGILKMSEEKSNIFMTPETAKGLQLIDKGRLVEERGAPAYVVMGNVNLANVIRAPIDDADKNLLTEAAHKLRPAVRATYGPDTTIYASQVTQVLKHLRLHENNDYCIQEKKLRRKYITRAGIEAVLNYIKSNPMEAIKVFGSKKAIARYEQK